MDSAREIVDYYLGVFRAGRWNDAFHGLIDFDAELIPELIISYDSTDESETKAFILRVISEFRRPVAFAFLKQELQRDDPRIWKLALNGLTVAQSYQSIEAMSEAVRSVSEPEKKAWIMEAIRDTTLATKKAAEQGASRQPPGAFALTFEMTVLLAPAAA
jgi:hypothetical protein